MAAISLSCSAVEIFVTLLQGELSANISSTIMLPPEILKACRRKFGIADGVLD
jgi:hypothetical protein